MNPLSRSRVFRRNSDQTLTDTGWDLCVYATHGSVWEPADTVFANGYNGPTKKWTDITIVDDTVTLPAPISSNVSYPKTGTIAF